MALYRWPAGGYGWRRGYAAGGRSADGLCGSGLAYGLFCGHVTRDAAPADAWGRKTGAAQIVPADTSINFLHYNPEFGMLDHETKFDTDKDGSFKVMDLEPGTYYVRSFETWYTSSSSGTGSFAEATPVVVGADAAAACTVEIQQRLNNSCTTGEVTGEIHSDPAVDLNRYGVTIF